MIYWTGGLVKTTDEPKTGATVLNDNTLVLTLNASKWYRLRFQINCWGDGTGDFRWCFLGAAVTAGMLALYGSTGMTAVQANMTISHDPYDLTAINAGTALAMNGSATTTVRGFIAGHGLIQTPASSPGTFAFKWSQNVNTPATPAVVYAGSYLLWEEFT